MTRDLEALRARMMRPPTKEEIEEMRKNLTGTADWKMVVIEDGHQFMRDLRKEAKRQRAMKVARDLELQARKIEHIPYQESIKEEIELADSFEIIEE